MSVVELAQSALIVSPPRVLAADLSGEMTGIALVGMCIGGMLLYTLIRTIGRMSDTRAREQTKREVAAYVAEGSITPDAAERLLRAGSDSWADQVAEMVKDGHIDSEEAERMLKAHAAAADSSAASAATRASIRVEGTESTRTA